MDRTTLLKIDDMVKADKRAEVKDLQITDFALSKAKAYAKVICAISHEDGIRRIDDDWEGYGYLLRDEWSLDDVISDICFAEDQSVSSAHVRVSASGVNAAVQDSNNLGQLIFGWWHSHGNFSVFHSGTDFNNFITVARSVAPNTMHFIDKVQPLREDKYMYFGDVRLELTGQETPFTIQKKFQRNPFAYSLVVNKRGDNYMERREMDLNTRALMQPERVGIKVIPSDKTFVMSDVELDVRMKLGLRPVPRQKQGLFSHYVSDGFVKRCMRYLARNKNPELEQFLHNVSTVPLNQIYSARSDARDIDPVKMKEKLAEMLVYTPRGHTDTFDAHDLHSMLLKNFIQTFAVDKVDVYAKLAAQYNECTDKANLVTRALCGYAMLPISNGKSNLEDGKRVNYFLQTLNKASYAPIYPNFSGIGNSVFIYTDKCNIQKQFLAGYLRNAVNGNNNTFLDNLLDFSKEVLSGKNELLELSRQNYEPKPVRQTAAN